MEPPLIIGAILVSLLLTRGLLRTLFKPLLLILLFALVALALF
jgi:hypothetical protein